jgi:hypothetical protein
VRHSEALYEDDSFPERELAALVAAKVYYQLQEYNESMVFALGAGKLFDIHKAAEFEETIMGKTYTNAQKCTTHALPCMSWTSISTTSSLRPFMRLTYLSSEMFRYLHCPLRHAQPTDTGQQGEPSTSTIEHIVSCELGRSRQHFR